MRRYRGMPGWSSIGLQKANDGRRRSTGHSLLRFITVGLATCCVIIRPASSEDLKKSGTVRIEQVQIAFIGSGNLGGGTLQFGGKSYDFTIGGLGIGGIGLSKITATGNVYNLDKIEYFPGAYVQGRIGFAVGETSAGKLWLK